MDIRDKLKPIEGQLEMIKKHIEQADLYMRYKSKKALLDTKQILFVAVHSYLKDIMNSHPTDKGIESELCQADCQTENAQLEVSCTQRRGYTGCEQLKNAND